jgi:class 3 adenylate cyclase
MTKNLVSLDELLEKRLSIVALEEKRLRDLSRANSIAQRMLSPGERILGAQMADWDRNQETAEASQSSREKSDIEKANLQAAAIQALNRNIWISIAALSPVSSLLIVWRYVGRNLIARITALSDSMLAIPQFTGDSIYAIFGAPDSMGERGDALACLRMALEMQMKMKTLREKWWNQGVQFPFEIRCGIYTGMANLGNYGSEGFMEYSAIGLNTNLASRLEQACQPGEIFLSHTSWALVNDEIPCEEVGTIEVKGFHYPIQTYRVLQHDVEMAPES